MEQVFFAVVNMSITASVAIVIVLLLRIILKKKAPKWLMFAIWGIVLARLFLPFSVASPLSIFNAVPPSQRAELTAPETGRVSRIEFVYHPQAQQNTSTDPGGTEKTDGPGQPPVSSEAGPEPGAAPRGISWPMAAACIWLAGVALMLGMSLFFFIKVKLRLRTAVKLRNQDIVEDCIRTVGIERTVKVYKSSMFTTPVVSGIFRPKIILPSYLNLENETVLRYILIHELVHIRRRDMLWKLLSLLGASIHWFNPLVWLAFYLIGKDMESACDERVLSFAREDIRSDYARSLLAMAIRQQNLPVAAGMVAFGESNVRTRIKDIMKYQKRTALAVVLAVVLLAVSSFTLLSNPQALESDPAPAPQPPQSQTAGNSDPPGQESKPEPEEMDYTPYFKKYLIYLDADGNMGLFSSPEDISPDTYFSYAVGRLYNGFITKRNMAQAYGDEFARKDIPEEYYDEQYGNIYPQEEIEQAVMEHFDVTREYLRSASSYMPERQGYAFLSGPGFGETTESIITGVREDGSLLHITYQVMTQEATYEVYGEDGVTQEHVPARYLGSKTLTVREEGEKFWYVSLDTASPDTQAIANILMSSYVPRYEVASLGAAFSDAAAMDLHSAYFYAVDKLLANGAAKEYAVYSDELSADGSPIWLHCNIPAQRVYQTALEDFGLPIDAWEDSDISSYDPQTDTFSIGDSQPATTDDTFVLEDAKDLGNHRIELTVSRKQGETIIDSHIYTFAVTMEKPGEESSELFETMTAQFISCEDTRDISEMAVIPEVTGMPYQQAISVLYNAGFQCQPVPLGESWRVQGNVVRMDPPAGSEVSRLTCVVQLYCELP